MGGVEPSAQAATRLLDHIMGKFPNTQQIHWNANVLLSINIATQYFDLR